jgi:alpha-glucosidase (family GH31 glycosyl hydrolase)
MLEKGNYREVSFPKGKWKDKNGTVIKGPVKKKFYIPLDELLWFKNN